MAKIEVFTAGCPLCEPAVAAAREGACPNCEVVVLDVNQPGVVEIARGYGITQVPSVVVNGEVLGAATAEAVRQARLSNH